MFPSCRDSATKKWRRRTFLHSVRRSPSLLRYMQIISLARLLYKFNLASVANELEIANCCAKTVMLGCQRSSIFTRLLSRMTLSSPHCCSKTVILGCTHAVRELPHKNAGYGCRNNTTVSRCPEAVGWAPLV